MVLGVAGEMTLADMCWSIRLLTSTHLFPAIFSPDCVGTGFLRAAFAGVVFSCAGYGLLLYPADLP